MEVLRMQDPVEFLIVTAVADKVAAYQRKRATSAAVEHANQIGRLLRRMFS